MKINEIIDRADRLKEKDLTELFEHQAYKNISGTKSSYREDPANTNTMTNKHAHVYAKLKGKGPQLYSVNKDGSGHDGSSGREIPNKHAEFLRSKGYSIPDNNILESLVLSKTDKDLYELIILEDTNA